MARTKRRANTSGIQTQSHSAIEQHQLSTLKPSDPSSIAPNYGKEGDALQTQSYSALEHQPCTSKPSYPLNGFPNPDETGVSSTTNTRGRKRTHDLTAASNVIQTRSRGAFDQHQPSTSKPSDTSNGRISLIITRKSQKRACENVSTRDFMQIQSHVALEQRQPSAPKPSDPTNGSPSFGGTGVSLLSNTRKCRSTRSGRKRTLDDATAGNDLQVQTHCAVALQELRTSKSSDSSSVAPSSGGIEVSSLNDKRKDQEKSIDNGTVRQTQTGCALELHQPSTLKPSDHSNSALGSTEKGLRIKLKKGRGPAKGSDDWGSGEKLHLEFNEFMEPVGANKDKFMSQLGIIARNGLKVPLTYTSWSEVPSEVLNSLWREVQENTNAPLEYCVNCLKSIGKLWRNWKHLVKANHYLAHETDDERLSYVPPRVIDDQWKTLVKYWGSEQARNITNRNKANRELQGLPHRTGRKGFSDIRFKMQQEGESTDRVSLWVKTRTPSFGAQHDPIATEGNSRARKRAFGNTSKRDAIQTQSDFTLEQLQPSTVHPSDPSCNAPNSGEAGRSFSTNTRKGPSMRKGPKSTRNNASPGNGIQMQTHCALSQQQFSLSNSSDSSNVAPSSSEPGASSLNDERILQNGILDDASVVDVIERQIQYGLEQHQPGTSPSDPTNPAPNSVETGKQQCSASISCKLFEGCRQIVEKLEASSKDTSLPSA
ncbi:hypothetical protein Sjap_023806 [Stephania japonica]|uniref:Uncharacterized protein n=1 Tax=Stephania japonica TaxID=461633 RepID=A0AAP0HKV6_9MAGN